MERPIRNAMRTIQRLACGWSAVSYQRHIAQNTSAVNSDDIAYTSPSTALNQNVSENVYASAPTAPEAIIAIACPFVISSVPFVISSEVEKSLFTTLLAKNTIVRYRKKMVSALRIPFMAFTATAALSAPKGMVKNLAIS